ncbi:MAG: hypothetical protein K8R49_03310 [Candidatus Cloacimonetes bacterium]|nr:hypothetical protein [Candidatus Cloacimonadota bacterium]
MYFDKEKVLKAREVILKLANGEDPINKEQISSDSFLIDPQMIRYFFFIAEVLESVSRQRNKNLPVPTGLTITFEEKEKVFFPEGKIGVNIFSSCINDVLDLNRSKKLSGTVLNKHLKTLGILSEENTRDGKTRTIINEKSAEFGFEAQEKEYNSVTYEQVMINDKGKKYLLENLEDIMNVET